MRVRISDSDVLPAGRNVASGGLTVRAGAVEATADLELYEPRGAADDPLLPAIVRAPGDVARTATGDPLAPCDVVTVYADGG